MSAGLPDTWAAATLGDLCFKSQYGWTTKAVPEGRVRLLRTTDITSGAVDWSRVPYCADEPEDLDKFRVTPGDIFISRAGSVGYSTLITDEPPEPTVFASYLIRFRPVEEQTRPFLALFLRSPNYWTAIGAEVIGIALGNVNATKLSAVRVPVPPLDEQQRIVERAETLMSQVDRAMQSIASVAGPEVAAPALEEVEGLAGQLKQAILHRAFAGDLVSQQPSSEPVSDLLERIKESKGRQDSSRRTRRTRESASIRTPKAPT